MALEVLIIQSMLLRVLMYPEWWKINRTLVPLMNVNVPSMHNTVMKRVNCDSVDNIVPIKIEPN